LFVVQPSPMSSCAVQEETLGSGSGTSGHTRVLSTAPKRLGAEKGLLGKQIAEAVAAASPDHLEVEDLYKIKWGTRRFILDGQFHKRKTRGRRSWISLHGHFLTELTADNKNKAEVWSCSICDRRGTPQVFICQSTSSSIHHLNETHKIFESSSQSDQEPSVLDMQRNASLKRPSPFQPSSVPQAKMMRLHELMTGYIVDYDLPFSTFENEYIQSLLRLMDPKLAEQLSMGKTKMRTTLEKIFEQHKTTVQEELQTALTKIHISFDLWTSPNRMAFISIFGHYINKKQEYHSRLLAFRRQSGAHSGENVAYTIEGVLKEWDIQRDGLGVAVGDNASSNDTCVKALYTQLDPAMRTTDVEARRMRCLGHILNLVAKAFLFGTSADSFELESDNLITLRQFEADLLHWRKKGAVGKLHNVVKFIRASPQRTEAFKRHAKEMEDEDVYKLYEESRVELELMQDNNTRWNSTYLMITRAWEKQAEIASFILKLDREEKNADKRIPPGDKLTDEDWKVLAEIREVLKPLYDMTMRTQGWGSANGHGRLFEVMLVMEWILDHLESWKDLYCEEPAELTNIPTPSSTEPSRTRSGRHARSQPTFNTSALPPHARQEYLKKKHIPNTAIETLQASDRAHMRTSINNAWEKLNEYYILLGKSPLYAASIILNPKLGLKFLEKSWTSEKQLVWLRDAKVALENYFERWYTSVSLSVFSSIPSTPEPSLPTQARTHEPDDFEQWLTQSEETEVVEDNELERYYRRQPESISDPQQWWIEHQSQYPRLSRLALDILAIPAMASDCERSFSLAKLTITSQRHRLQASTVEMLQLMKNWLRSGVVTLGGVSRQRSVPAAR